MKKIICAVIVGLTGISAFAASPAAVIAAVKAARSVTDITDIREVSRARCMDCFVIEINGQGAFGPAYVRVQTERTNPNAIRAVVIDQSR